MRPDRLMHNHAKANLHQTLPCLYPLPLELPILRRLSKGAHLNHFNWEPNVEQFLGVWREANKGCAAR
jgi:hypothetical protein